MTVSIFVFLQKGVGLPDIVNITGNEMNSSSGSSNDSTRLRDELSLQESYYAEPLSKKERKPCKDLLDSIKRSLKDIYRDVKFISDPKRVFDKPNFVDPYFVNEDGEKEKYQAVTLCEVILENMSKCPNF